MITIVSILWCIYRLTKSLNVHDEYRISHRGSNELIRAVDRVIGFCYVIGVCLCNPQWFMDHFVNLRTDSANYLPLQQWALLILFTETWDLVNRSWYTTISWSVLFHHWLSIAFCSAFLRGLYSPMLTWFGITVVFCGFPINFAEVLRLRYSFLYPEQTRMAFRISFWWFIGQLTLNLCGQIFVVSNSLLYHYNDSIPVWTIVITVMAICGFSWMDYKTAKALWRYSTLRYELADFLKPNTVGTDTATVSSQTGGETQSTVVLTW